MWKNFKSLKYDYDFQDSTDSNTCKRATKAERDLLCRSLDSFELMAGSSSVERAINVICVTVERMMSRLTDALWEYKPKRLNLCMCVWCVE